MDPLTSIPPKPRAGDTWTWTRSLSDYPASTWTGTVYLLGPNGAESEAAADGDDHVFTIADTVTAQIPAGELQWFERYTDGTSVVTLSSGTITVLANYAAGMPFEARTTAKQMLDAVESTILKLLSRTTQSASFGDKNYTIHDLDKLRQIRADLRSEVSSESGRNNIKTIRIKFPTV